MISIIFLILLPAAFLGLSFRYHVVTQDVKEVLQTQGLTIEDADFMSLTHPSWLTSMGMNIFIGLPIWILLTTYNAGITTAGITFVGIIIGTLIIGATFPTKGYILKSMRDCFLARKESSLSRISRKLTKDELDKILASISVLYVRNTKAKKPTEVPPEIRDIFDRYKLKDIYEAAQQEVKQKQAVVQSVNNQSILNKIFSEEEIDLLGEELTDLVYKFDKHKELANCGIKDQAEYYFIFPNILLFRLSYIEYYLKERVRFSLIIAEAMRENFFNTLGK